MPGISQLLVIIILRQKLYLPYCNLTKKYYLRKINILQY